MIVNKILGRVRDCVKFDRAAKPDGLKNRRLFLWRGEV